LYVEHCSNGEYCKLNNAKGDLYNGTGLPCVSSLLLTFLPYMCLICLIEISEKRAWLYCHAIFVSI